MGTATGLFKNSSTNYSITIVGGGITTATFNIVGEVVTQTGNQTRNVTDVFSPIRATQLRFSVREAGVLFEELGGLGLQDALVTLTDTDAGEIKFIGYVQPINIEKNEYWNSGTYTITCTDGLAQLEQKPYTLSGFITISDFLKSVLSTVGTISQAIYIGTWQEAQMATSAPNLIRFNANELDVDNDLEALRIILTRFNLIISLSNKRGLVEWRIIERSAIGQNLNGWIIDLSSGSVTSQAQDDSVTLTDSDIIAEHIKGKTDAIQRVETKFNWNIDDPLILNNSFQQWNEALDVPRFWDVIGGSVTRDTVPTGTAFTAVSTDNARIKQRLNYIKQGGVPFELSFRVQPIWDGSRLINKEITYAVVSFIDPSGEADTLYLANDGSVSTVQLPLKYEVDLPNGSAQFIATPTVTLQAGTDAFATNRIVEVELFFSRVDQDLNTIFSAVEWQSVETNIEAVERPNQLLTRADSGELGTVLVNEFTIGEQTVYNAKGAIEVFDGESWVAGRDWDAGEDLEVVYVRSISSQTKRPLSYYKLTVTPPYFGNQANLDGFSYAGALYTPNYQVVNYTNKTAEYQIIELTNLLPNNVTQITLAVGEDSVIYDKIPIAPLTIEVVEVNGTVSFSYPKPRAIDPPFVVISWVDIIIYLENGSEIIVPNGQAEYELFSVFSPIVFFYDRDEKEINSRHRTLWYAITNYRDTTRYVKLFTIYKNQTVDGISDPSAPIAVPSIEPVAKALFALKEADRQAVISETIWSYQTDAIAKLASDLDGDYSALPIDPNSPTRVTLAQGDRITLYSGNRNYDLIVASKTIAGALSIPIQSRYILAYAGAKIKYSEASTGSQLLIQPDKVLVVAQNADSNATSALELIAGQGTAVAELSAVVLGENGLGNSAGIKFEVDTIGARSVLKVDGGGNIASIDLLSGEENTAVKIKADQIDVVGQTTFYSSLSQAIINEEIFLPNVDIIYSSTQPTTRTNGSALRDGDIWVETPASNNGVGTGRQFKYVALSNAFTPNFTSINGGIIETGTIFADKINVSDLFSKNIGVTGSIYASSIAGRNVGYVELNGQGLVGYNNGIKTFEVPTNGAPRFLSGEIQNVTVKIYEATQTVIKTSDDPTVDGGLILDRFGIRAYTTSGLKTVDIDRNGNATFTGAIVATSGSLRNLNIDGDINMSIGGNIVIGNNFEISQDGIIGDNIRIVNGEVSVNQLSGETYSISENGIFARNADNTRAVDIEDTGIFIKNNAQSLSLTLNTTTGALSSSTGFRGVFYGGNNQAGVSQTISNPTTFVISNGIITSVS